VSFSTADGVYVLDSALGTIRLVTAEGRAYSYAFRDEAAPAAAANDAAIAADQGRYQGQLLKGVLFVLDRKTGMLISLSAATLVKQTVIDASGRAVRPADVPTSGGNNITPAGGGNDLHAGPGLVNGGDHLPPPPVYAAVTVPKEVSDADRQRSQRDIDDYSGSIGHPSMGKPTDTGYELNLTLENRGKRTLAALEETIEYTDPKSGKVVQQRLYFRKDNGATNAPPAPGKGIAVTIRLPNFESVPAVRVYTSYLVFDD
ncbi:MAG TPA: hypothetical protein VL860_13235, partial [Planctomycetota bacterium]|nr:hypothetical protein [Planctomycetota bacterium]